MEESLFKMLQEKQYSPLKESIEAIITKKLHNQIQAKKVEILADRNKVTVEQMMDIINVKG